MLEGGLRILQAAEKRPSAALPSSFVVAAYSEYASLLRISGALHLGIFEQPAKSFLFQKPKSKMLQVKCLGSDNHYLFLVVYSELPAFAETLRQAGFTKGRNSPSLAKRGRGRFSQQHVLSTVDSFVNDG